AGAEGTARVRRKVEAAPHDGGVVSLVRGGRGEGREEKEVTARQVLVTNFPLDENPRNLKNEKLVVFGKIAGRGHGENPARRRRVQARAGAARPDSFVRPDLGADVFK